MIGRIFSSHKKLWIISAIVVGIIVIAGTALLLTKHIWAPDADDSSSTGDTRSSKEIERLSTNLNQDRKDNTSVDDIVASYGTQYDSVMKELRDTAVSRWTDEMIDRAHFCLLYADRTGAHAQVIDIYYQIMAAQGNGKNVDANAAGITQDERQEIYTKALAAQGQGVGTGE